jgi:hypothetical protein
MLRARFVVVPLVVLGLPTAYLASLAVSDALEEREDRRNAREYDALVAPALRAAEGVRIEGFRPCDPPPRDGVCLRGTGDVEATASAVAERLTDAGATDAEAKCRESDGKASFCTAAATFGRARVEALVTSIGGETRVSFAAYVPV